MVPLRLGRELGGELANLVLEALYLRRKGLHEVRSRGGTAVGQVVREKCIGIERSGREANPIITATSCPARQRGIPDRVLGIRFVTIQTETCLRVGITAGNSQQAALVYWLIMTYNEIKYVVSMGAMALAPASLGKRRAVQPTVAVATRIVVKSVDVTCILNFKRCLYRGT
jgi:hypothetical protein